MRRRIGLLMAVAWLGAPGFAYIRVRGSSGAPAARTDFAGMQFFINADAAPGMTNADGNVMVTADSDIMGAIAAAMAEWNGVATSAARFLPVETTATMVDPLRGGNNILILDSPAIRSLMGPSLNANTLSLVTGGGTLLSSNIVLNPQKTFSTTGAPNTFDLQSVLAKQLGAAMGASESPILGAALGFNTQPNATFKQTLSAEDTAFATAVYPADLSGYGTLGGTLTLDGAPVRNALIIASDPSSGATLSALSWVDGTWSVAAPPGNYVIYAQPLSNLLRALIQPLGPVDRSFLPSFLGGNGSPAPVAVTAGNSSNADFSPAAADGSTQPALYGLAAVAAGAPSGLDTIVLPELDVATGVVSGQTLDISVIGPGIDGSLADANIMLLGPLALQPGSVRADGGFPFEVNGVTLQAMRFTVSIAPVQAQTPVTLVITSGSSFAAYAGGIVLEPAPAPGP